MDHNNNAAGRVEQIQRQLVPCFANRTLRDAYIISAARTPTGRVSQDHPRAPFTQRFGATTDANEI